MHKNLFLYLTSSIWEVIDEKFKIPIEQLWESLLSGKDNSILSEIKTALIRNLINEVEAELAKKTGVPIRVLEEQNKKLKEPKRKKS